MMNSNNILIKGLIVALMIIVMLIPIQLVKNLIEERENNKVTVDAEVNEKWGGSQQLTGPILVVPYEPSIRIQAGKEPPKGEPKLEYAYFLPDNMTIDSDLQTEERGRSLFKALVYQAKMKIAGSFSFPDNEKLHIKDEKMHWEEAYLVIGISDLQGIKNRIELNVNGELLAVQPGVPRGGVTGSGITIPLSLAQKKKDEKINFSFDLLLNGTEDLSYSLAAKEMQVNMQSDWSTVSFTGNTFPTERDFTNGFTAKWDLFDYNTTNVFAWTGENNSMLSDSNFGVSLRMPVNQYQMNMRAVKYAIMFIALTFVAFFLVEILSRRRIHPMQYVLVSFALIIFYTLLLSLSEHIGFELSYLISAIAIVAMVSLYSLTIFSRKKHAAMMGGCLAILYSFLYIVLQLENLALLFGSVGLFLALAIVMYASRKIDWYKIGISDEDREDEEPKAPQKPSHIIIQQQSRPQETPPPYTPDNE
ncbi:cell envelope integrity protein CreD [Dysgonomonas sp. 25]|uniref:cell envelope integrity protein CreD n=1 Tax=Dysgonomonas sp. 25 TaxID=2302933 RepID=UPI0013D65202|nr:cell envelope integrity protein CreD [Dysgonomonas sp. 25]NDV69601.1 cell envelope integrity protein CreD [Dysgonomonas sp. 25]